MLVAAKSLLIQLDGQDFAAEDIEEFSGRWHRYCHAYWQHKRTAIPWPNDFVCEAAEPQARPRTTDTPATPLVVDHFVPDPVAAALNWLTDVLVHGLPESSEFTVEQIAVWQAAQYNPAPYVRGRAQALISQAVSAPDGRGLLGSLERGTPELRVRVAELLHALAEPTERSLRWLARLVLDADPQVADCALSRLRSAEWVYLRNHPEAVDRAFPATIAADELSDEIRPHVKSVRGVAMGQAPALLARNWGEEPCPGPITAILSLLRRARVPESRQTLIKLLAGLCGAVERPGPSYGQGAYRRFFCEAAADLPPVVVRSALKLIGTEPRRTAPLAGAVAHQPDRLRGRAAGNAGVLPVRVPDFCRRGTPKTGCRVARGRAGVAGRHPGPEPHHAAEGVSCLERSHVGPPTAGHVPSHGRAAAAEPCVAGAVGRARGSFNLAMRFGPRLGGPSNAGGLFQFCPNARTSLGDDGRSGLVGPAWQPSAH